MHRKVAVGWAISLAGILAAAACGDISQHPLETDEVSRRMQAHGEARRFSGTDVVAQDLARALSTALADPAVRAGVRNAMRSSPYVEHKLVLSEFVQTRVGEAFLRSAAQRSRYSTTQLGEMIAALPPLDFYVPVDAHRSSWRGDGNVALGLNLDVKDPTVFAYTPQGRAVILDSRDGTPAVTLFLLHPAEWKFRRENADQAVTGETISQAGEMRLLSIDGDCEPSDTAIQPIGCDASGAPGIHALTRFRINQGDGWGRSEMRIRIIQQNVSGGSTVLHQRRFGGLHPHQWYDVDWRFTGMGSYATAEELDAWFTFNNDSWGTTFSNYAPKTPGYRPSGTVTHFTSNCGSVHRDNPFFWPSQCAGLWDARWDAVDAIFTY